MSAARPLRPLFRGTMQPSDDLGAFLAEQVSEGLFWAEKLDGERCVAGVAPGDGGGRVTFFGRSGLRRDRATLAHLEAPVRALALALCEGQIDVPVLLDGELLGGDLHVFDLIDTVPGNPLWFRLRRLRQAFLASRPAGLRLVEHHFLPAERAGELRDIAAEVIAEGGEGIVAKAAGSGYRPCVSPAWVRIKRHQTWDLRVLSATWKGGLVSSLVCAAPGGGLVRVSAGMSDAQRAAFSARLPRLVEVRAQEETRAGSLREPVFVRVREDK